MNTLDKPVRQARRRLWLNRWLAALGWCLAGAAGLFILAVIVQRVALVGLHLPTFLTWTALGLTGAALLTSLIWAIITRDSRAAAAARLDEAAGLKERISTGLHCRSLDDPFAQAVVADAERIGRGITPARHLPIRVPHSANWAGGTAVAALLFFWLFPVVDLSGKEEEQRERAERSQRVERTVAVVEPVLQQQLRRIADRNPDLKDEIDSLEPMDADRLKTPLDARREAVKQVQKLEQKLEERRSAEDIAAVEELQRMMRRLASQRNPDTPVGRLADALSRGDFKDAQKAIEDMKLELARAPETEAESQQAEELRRQLSQLAEKLKEIAEDTRRTEDQLARAGLDSEQIQRALESLSKKDFDAIREQLKEQGLDDKQIEQMVEQMQNCASACSVAQQMGQNLGQGATGGTGQGQGGLAGEAGFSAASDQLSELEALQQQLNSLNAAMADLDAAKDQLGRGCTPCQGTGMDGSSGCGACQGSGMCQGGMGGMGGGMGGPGIGAGGIAPREEADYQLVKERTPVHTTAGRIIHQRFIDGEQFRGEATSELVDVTISAERYATDAINTGQMPRIYQEPVRRYFDRSREGLPAELVEQAAQD